MSNASLTPLFLESVSGKIFVLYRSPSASDSTKAVVVLPPFADEMNKSRHMLNLLSTQLCEENYHVITPDLYGTGDSQGEFKEADWDTWLGDIEVVIEFLEARGVKNISLFGMRTGALLAADIINKYPGKFEKLILWHPVVDGNVFLNQFLRLRVASAMMSKDENKETTKALFEKFLNGSHVEVAGYDISPNLALALKEKSLKNKQLEVGNIIWIDLVASIDRDVPMVNKKVVERWNDAANNVTHDKCVGELFWASLEIAELPSLINMTLKKMKNSNESK